MEEQDPFDFILQVSEISRSQEEILRVCPISGEHVSSGDIAPPISPELQAEPAGLFMLSMPETQDPGRFAASGSGIQEQEKDVFHTPPEKSSLPSSGDQPSEHCTVNHELEANEDTQGFVYLGDSEGIGCVDLGIRESDLGFSEVQPSSPRRINRDDFAEELDGIDVLQVKKSKLSEPKSGFDDSRGCLGVESEEVELIIGNLGFGAESPFKPCRDNKISAMKKNLGGSGHHELKDWEVEGQKKKKTCIIDDVLKFISENSDDDDEDNDENGGLCLDVVNILGVDFPRPRWWPDTDLFRRGK